MYLQPGKSLWKGRIDDQNDPDSVRWHQKITCQNINDESWPPSGTSKIAITGYASDLGCEINKGRKGSKEGPATIRRELANLAWHNPHRVLDTGDVVNNGESVDQLQVELGRYVFTQKKNRCFTIILGGSHDLTFGHFFGIQNFLREQKSLRKLGVINLDAHLDLRPYPEGPHSGSPFLQMADYCKKYSLRFEYLALGIANLANTKALFKIAKQHNVQIISDAQFCIQQSDLIRAAIDDFLSRVDVLLLSVDMDGFNASLAPGVSAPAHRGFSSDIVYFSLDHIFKSGKVIGFDIAETNPRYDIDNRTSRMAAALVHYVCDKVTR